MKLVINRCYGGFSLSSKAFLEWVKRENPSGWTLEKGKCYFSGFNEYHLTRPNPNRIDGEEWLTDRDIPRENLNLVDIVTEMGIKANGRCAELKVVEIPDGTDYEIDEYDGLEKVVERHHSWDGEDE